MTIKNLSLIFSTVIILAACSKSDSAVAPVIPVVPADTTSTPISSPARETFESGIKNDYATSTISLSTGKWSFNNAVIGTSAEDAKVGSKSVRIQESGKVTMNFDIVNGVYRVVVGSASYGADGPGTWQLWASSNSGNSYTQIGSNIVTTSNTLQFDTIVVSAVSKIRFSIRKLTGGSKINIDEFQAILTSGPLAPNFADDNHMLLGNPTNATPSPLDVTNYYMDKTYFSLAYNNTKNKPTWVSWHLMSSDLGSTPRQDDFREDYALPSSWYYVTAASYTGSGLDRGHSCPSSDRTSSVAANSSTFLMTNIMPQAPNNNQLTWERLEDSTRRLITSSGQEAFIICGSFGAGGTGNNGFLTEIDNGRIEVPESVWKVIVVLPNGNNDYSRISASTRVIAVLTPNSNTIDNNWKTYRTSINAIETAAANAGVNLNLLSNIPEAIRTVLKARIDNL